MVLERVRTCVLGVADSIHLDHGNYNHLVLAVHSHVGLTGGVWD